MLSPNPGLVRAVMIYLGQETEPGSMSDGPRSGIGNPASAHALDPAGDRTVHRWLSNAEAPARTPG